MSKQDSSCKDSSLVENSQNLSSLLSAASPSSLSLVPITPSISNSTLNTMSSMLTSSAMRAEIKTEPLLELKQDGDTKDEKMDVKTEVVGKSEVNIIKDENTVTSPKLEITDENSQTSGSEEKPSVGDSSSEMVLTSTPKPRCKKSKLFLFFLSYDGFSFLVCREFAIKTFKFQPLIHGTELYISYLLVITVSCFLEKFILGFLGSNLELIVTWKN